MYSQNEKLTISKRANAGFKSWTLKKNFVIGIIYQLANTEQRD